MLIRILVNMSLVSYIVITKDRRDDLMNVLNSIYEQDYNPKEVIVVDNNSEKDFSTVFKHRFKNLHWIRLDENSGVPAARNIGIEASSGEFLIFLDDDAYFKNSDSTTMIVERFRMQESLSVISFQVLHPQTGHISLKEVPAIDKEVSVDEFECTYFAGGACAVRKEVLDATGLFSEEFFFTCEELDLSMRILAKGGKIIYFPQVEIYHKASPRNRPSWRANYYHLRNRVWIAIKYLPFPYVVVNSSIWFLVSIVRMLYAQQMKYFLTCCCEMAVKLPEMIKQRKPVDSNVIRELRQKKGRLFF